MDLKKNIMMIVSLIVAVIVTLSVLVPVLDDATATTDTFTNKGYDRFTSLAATDADSLSISWDHTDPSVLTIDDVDIAIKGVPTFWESIVFGENFTLRYTVTSSDVKLTYNGSTNAKYLALTASGSADLSITASAGTVTLTSGETTFSESYTTLYYPATDGELIMKSPTESAYLLSESQVIIANGITDIAGSGVGVYITGEFNDYTISFYRGSGITTSDVTSVYTTDNDHNNLVKLEKITFNATASETTTAVTYSYFLVPYEVTAERSIYVSSIEATLLNIIPLLVVIGIVMGAVWFIRQRN